MSAATSVARAQEALRLGRRERIVRHARLAPARDEDSAQMRFAVEDALNTADFGDCGRLIIVRRLRLHAVPAHASSALVSRALEAAWRSLAMRAVGADAPHAPQADAVFFASRVQARLAWLRRVATAADVSAWFWPSALPELRASAASGGSEPGVDAVVAALVDEAWTETRQAWEAWPDDAVTSLARCVSVPTSDRLLARLTVSASGTSTTSTGAASMAHRQLAEAAASQVVRRLAVGQPLPGSAASWVAALWLDAAMRREVTVAQARSVVRQALRGASSAPTPTSRHAPGIQDSDRLGNGGGDLLTPSSVPTAVPNEIATAQTTAPLGTKRSEAPPTSSPIPWRVESGLRSDQRLPLKRPVGQPRASSHWPWLADAEFTAHGGLMILPNLLQSMRFARWLEGQPRDLRHPFVDALFSQVLRACDASADDPQRAWFVRSDTDAHRWAAARFADGQQTLDAAQALRTWRLRLRHALRRHVGLDLHDLVNRSAWVSGTHTHIDVVFPLDEVDLRLRRRGLDSDPGWVSWLGRIVTFHFIERDLLPAADDDGDRHG